MINELRGGGGGGGGGGDVNENIYIYIFWSLCKLVYSEKLSENCSWIVMCNV